VKSYAQQQTILTGRDVEYFSWDQSKNISSAINGAPTGEPINLIGHSLGGAEAIRQADATDRTISSLVTIDPVDLPGQAVSPNLSILNVKTWVNVTSNPAQMDWSDYVAAAGGKVSSTVTDQADLNIDSRLHHGDFSGMMKQANAANGINATYNSIKVVPLK